MALPESSYERQGRCVVNGVPKTAFEVLADRITVDSPVLVRLRCRCGWVSDDIDDPEEPSLRDLGLLALKHEGVCYLPAWDQEPHNARTKGS